MGFIDQDGWEPNFTTWVKSFFKSAYTMRYVAPARILAQFAPLFANYMGENLRAVTRQIAVVIPRYIQKALDNPENGRVFAELMESQMLPEEEKSMYRLSGEGFNLLAAGTETTAVSYDLGIRSIRLSHRTHRLRSLALHTISFLSRRFMPA